MAFPVVATTNSGNQATDVTSHTINLPTGITAGDLLLLFMSFDGDSRTVTAPTGWTTLATSNTPTPYLLVAYKIANGSEGSTATATINVGEQSTHVTYRITGWHGATPPEISTVATGTSTLANPSSLNPTGWGVEDTLWIQLAAWDDGTTTVASHNLPDNRVEARANTSAGVGIAVETINVATSAEDFFSISLSASEAWKAYTIAVRPSAVTGSPPVADFSSSATLLAVQFTDASTDPDGNAITAWSWNFGTGEGTSTAQNPLHTFGSAGTKSVTLTVTDSTGLTNSVTKSVTVSSNQAPTANFTWTGAALAKTFTDTSSDADGTIASWDWNFGDGSAHVTTQNPSHTYTADGTYSVTLTVTDNLGATGSVTKSVTAIQPGAGRAYEARYIPKIETTLAIGMDASQTAAVLVELAYWPAEGEAIVGTEIISWTGKSMLSGTGNLTGVTRGVYGTTASSHSSGVTVGLLGRHDGSLLTRRKVALFPANSSITLQELRRHTDLDRFVWVDLNNFREKATLEITGTPTASGNVTTTLDENGSAVARTTAVSGAKEVRSLTINNAVSTSGNVTVTLDGVVYTIPVTAGVLQQHQCVLSGAAASNNDGNQYYYSDATTSRTLTNVTVNNGDSANTVAARIRASSITGWTFSGSGSTVIATATTVGPRGNPPASNSSYGGWAFFNADEPGQTETNTMLRIGVLGMTTAAQVADAIRNTSFPGWTTGGTPGTATVSFTAVESGVRGGTFSYSAGTTGATSTAGLTQTTAGSSTTAAAIATAIVTTYSGNTYWTVSAASNVVTFVATVANIGVRQDGTFSPGSTGVLATMTTVEQGSTDVVAYVKDSNGDEQKRRVLANLATTTTFYLETAVSGAGTSKGIVTVWGAFGTDPLTQVWRVTDLDLTDYPLGAMAYGVTYESSTGLTWDVYTDEVEPTNRGKTYYCDHDQMGNLIGQARYYGRLDLLQATNDLFVQGLSIPVIPGETVVMAAKLRYENVPTELPAKPLFVTAHHADGTVTDLRDVTGTAGISGTADWNEPSAYTFVVPDTPSPCYEIQVSSRDMSSGFIVLQELVVSPGTLPNRTYYYATDGTVTVRYEGLTPQQTNALRLGRQRVALETQYEQPAATLTSEQYRSADDPDSFESTWYTDPADVLDRPVVETEVTLQGDGLSTPVLLSGFPRYEYKLQVGLQDQPTLNMPDGTEFPGAVVLDKREEWHPNTGIDVRVLTSGRVRRGKTHEPVGYIPKLSLWAFRPETVKYLMEHWGTEELIADWVDDEVLTLKLLANPEFERLHGTKNGPDGRAGEWKSKEIAAEVVSVRKRVTP